MPHVRLGRHADLVVVAPATADLLAKAAHGLADDLLTNTLLTARCPVVFAPAMHTEMWENPATRAQRRHCCAPAAYLVIEPAVGPPHRRRHRQGPAARPGGDLRGRARLLAPRAAGRTWPGRHVVVTAGGTREPLDPVRFLGNRSSGKQGYALARTAAARGARVTLIAANVTLPDPAGADVIRVGTTEELRKATVEAAAGADAIVMAAAPADFRPATVARQKIKEGRRRYAAGHRAGHQPRHRRGARRRQAPRSVARRVRRGDRTTRWRTHARSWYASGPT